MIPELVRQWRAGHDVVNAIRQRTDGEGWFKGLTSRGFYALLNALSGTKVPAGAADFCLLSRRVCQSLRDMPERHRFLRGLVSWAGFDRAFVPYVAGRRSGPPATPSTAWSRWWAWRSTPSSRSPPSHCVSLCARASASPFLGFVYLAWTLIYGYLLGGLVPGYSSLIGVTMILGGCQLMFIGLIGQYLARVFEEVKGRPIYLLKQEPPEARVRLRAAERG